MSMDARRPAPAPVIITLRMRGHAGASGYDRLQEFIGGQLIRTSEQLSTGGRILARALRFMTRRSGSLWYHRANLIGELAAARQWCRRRGQVFHFLYGENSYRYLGNLKSLGARNAVVCTYHTPPEKFAHVVRDRKHLARIDAVIVVSTMQMEYFAQFVGQERVHFIPHGIDVEYFRPAPSDRDQEKKDFQCLFVGSHLRDFATLAEAARLLRSHEKTRITVLTRDVHRSVFDGLSNVEFLSGLDDKQLLGMYQSADALVLPLLESTANNSVLEAMACGLPIVTTDLPGVRDYISPDCSILTKKQSATHLADSILSLEQDDRKRQRMADASRQRALEFRWETVADRVIGVYRSIGQNMVVG